MAIIRYISSRNAVIPPIQKSVCITTSHFAKLIVVTRMTEKTWKPAYKEDTSAKNKPRVKKGENGVKKALRTSKILTDFKLCTPHPARSVSCLLGRILVCIIQGGTYLFSISVSSPMVNGFEMLAVKPCLQGSFITEFSA